MFILPDDNHSNNEKNDDDETSLSKSPLSRMSSLSFKNKSTSTPESKSTSESKSKSKSTKVKEKVKVLCEIVGATNLGSSSEEISPYVIVKDKYGKKIHYTDAITKNANPIWNVTNGSLFMMDILVDDITSNDTEIELVVKNYDHQFGEERIGIASIEVGSRLKKFQGKRLEYDLHLCSTQNYTPKKETKELFALGDLDLTASLTDSEPARIYARFRIATPYDKIFMNLLETKRGHGDLSNWDESDLLVLCDARNCAPSAELISEKDHSTVAMESLKNKIMNNPFKSTRDARGMPMFAVKPYPNPSSVNETSYLTEEQMKSQMMNQSTNWIEAGSDKENLGKVFIEILKCNDLPNLDNGILGNLTDTFVCIVLGDGFAQTDVIDDCLNPIWMPWTQRAFAFNITHALSSLYIAAMDYDLGSNHEAIGRICINLNQFDSNVSYILTYPLYLASNVVDAEPRGSITIRLRKIITNEKKLLLNSLKTCPDTYVNMQSSRTLSVVNFACNGQYDEDLYQIKLLKSYFNEIFDLKRSLSYTIADSAHSIMYWKGQVQVGKYSLPLHSALLFLSSLHLVENPNHIPGSIFLFIGWIMIASMLHRSQQPSPWHRTKDLAYYLHILINGQAPTPSKNIYELEGYAKHLQLEENRKNRIKTDIAASKKKNLLNESMKKMASTTIHTEKKNDTNSLDPFMVALEQMKPFLFPVQNQLGGICSTLRNIKAIASWEESILSFWITLSTLAIGITMIMLPTMWILKWIFKIAIWVFLGPWMRIYRDVIMMDGKAVMDFKDKYERTMYTAKAMESVITQFRKRNRELRINFEQAIKRKAMRMMRFGKYIAKVPNRNLTRFYDRPKPTSYSRYDDKLFPPEEFHSKKVISGQLLYGDMIPLSANQIKENLLMKNRNFMSGYSYVDVDNLSDVSDAKAHNNCSS